jgi:GR25 family glycosyltransferase involved in LPS biosynthesis
MNNGFIDKIVYINLNKREDRKEKITKELDEFGLQYERFEAIEIPGSGLGCALSHLKVLENAKNDETVNNILILEDDFIFLVTKEEFYNEINSFFKHELALNYNVCFISYNVQCGVDLDNGIVNRALKSHTASGYIVNRNYFDTLIDLYRHSTVMLEKTKQHWLWANDTAWFSNQEKDNWFYFKKRIGKQAAGFSDNGGCFTDHNV